MQKITPFLWFNDKAEEAVNFYVSTFKNSKAVSFTRYGDAGPGPKGTAMVAVFEIEGQQFLALNGGPQFTFTPAVSFVVNCETQQEVDDLWEKLSAGGRGSRFRTPLGTMAAPMYALHQRRASSFTRHAVGLRPVTLARTWRVFIS